MLGVYINVPSGLNDTKPLSVFMSIVKVSGSPSTSVSFKEALPFTMAFIPEKNTSSTAIGASFTGVTVKVTLPVSHMDGIPLSHTT